MQNSTQQANNKRREKDVMKLMMSGKFDVQLVNDESTQEFDVLFEGPADSHYEGGTWKVRVQLPDLYPYKSPSIGFKNRIYHPNIDEASGSVCLDVINQTWSPMYDLINIFEIFLPQLLLYPNPTDPLNPEAAQMQLKYEDKYKERIKEYVKKYAQRDMVLAEMGKPVVNGKKGTSQQAGSHSNGGAKNGGKKDASKEQQNEKNQVADNLSETSLGAGADDDDDDMDDADLDDVDDDDLNDDVEDSPTTLQDNTDNDNQKIEMIEKKEVAAAGSDVKMGNGDVKEEAQKNTVQNGNPAISSKDVEESKTQEDADLN